MMHPPPEGWKPFPQMQMGCTRRDQRRIDGDIASTPTWPLVIEIIWFGGQIG